MMRLQHGVMIHIACNLRGCAGNHKCGSLTVFTTRMQNKTLNPLDSQV